ncbi:MAG: hypothetical protein HMLIMOIP_002667 [Candidatus Nitrosomirales archaeon]|jgi:hypothetical protein
MGVQEIQDYLKGRVTTLLVSEHEFLIEDAEEAVKESFASRPELWGENADPNDLAKFLASDENDD